MPWTKEDVDKHKKGLTDAQKEQWVRIANEVRKKCIDDGGNPKKCDARAIRIANSKVGNTNNVSVGNYSEVTGNLAVEEGGLHTNKLKGEDHYVVPVVLLVEGVHNGSSGPVFYPSEEIEKYPAAWNGRSIPVKHPYDGKGRPLSANSPEEWEKRQIGWLFNVHVDYNEEANDGEPLARLVGNAWINKKDVAEKSPEINRNIQEGVMSEVSTGIFADWEFTTDYWKGEFFDKIAKNMRPDHLAALEGGEKGACSIPDGAGLMRNKENSPTMNVLQEVRTPDYKGASNSDWSSIGTDFNDFYTAWNLSAETWEELTPEERKRISATSLLGNSKADTFEEGLFFPVVEPSTGKLNKGALYSVIHNGGSQAGISDKALNNARRKSYDLLNKVWNENLDVPDDLQKHSFFRKVFDLLNSSGENVANQESVSYEELGERIRSALRGKYGGEDTFVFIERTYKDYVIYSVARDGVEEKTYREGYTLDENGEVVLDGNHEEVRIRSEIVPVQSNNTQTGGESMNRQEIIDGLISNTSVFAEDDRQVLEGKEDEALQELHNKFLKEPENPAGNSGGGEGNPTGNSGGGEGNSTGGEQVKEGGTTNADIKAVVQNLSFDQILQNADPETRETVEEGRRVAREEKEQHKQAILNCANNKFTREELDNMSLQALRRTASLIPKEADMKGRVSASSSTSSRESSKPAPLGTINTRDESGGKKGKGEEGKE